MSDLPFNVTRKLFEQIVAGDLTVEVTSDNEGRPVQVSAYMEGQRILGPMEGEVLERIARTIELQRESWMRTSNTPRFQPDVICPKHGYEDRDPTQPSYENRCLACSTERAKAAQQVKDDAERVDLDAPRADPHDEPRAASPDDIPF